MSLSLGVITGSMSRKAGGLFNSVRKSSLSLSSTGVKVNVYALEDEHSSDDLREWEPLNPEVLSMRLGRLFPFAPELACRLVKAEHDVLHLHGIWQSQSQAVNNWKHKTGKPVMISPRGMLDPWALANSAWKKKIAGALFEYRNLREADCMHALNAAEASSMRRFGLSNPIAIIPNATDLPDIAPRKSRGGVRTLLFLGRIHPKKGLAELVMGWARACQRSLKLSKTWRLEIAGWDDGGHVLKLVRQIADLGLGDSIQITGPSFGEEKDALLRRADAFVLPSFSEGMPMTALEAWAYRLPVYMTSECNLPEGFLHKAAFRITTDPDAMAEVFLRTLLHEDLEVVGEAGRSLVERSYSWPKVAQELISVYQWTLGEGDAPPCVHFVDA